jgi:anti-sigma B factor antagonist
LEFYFRGVEKDVLILKADGGIDSTNAHVVMAELTRLVESGIRKLVVDCAALHHVSSAGVGTLVRLHRKLWAVGGHAKVASVQGTVFRLLEATKLAKAFEIYPTVEDALAAFRNAD